MDVKKIELKNVLGRIISSREQDLGFSEGV